ncbi:MAG: polyphosphate kinase 1 [Chloroflexi bacterium]|nr:polyphosphate kinase 1 [Chloroflexota bacterium]
MADEQKIDLENPALYINRELSMLEYFRRILEEAQDDRNPLLERVKFLAFVGINMDEFFMVRVAGLKQQLAAGVVDIPADGMTAAEQLAAIRKMAASLMNDARKCWYSDIKPKLDEAGIHVLEYKELNDSQREKVEEHFQEVVFPVLTPLAFDPGRPFPHISNLSLSLAVIVQEKKGQQRFARVKVPDTLPRLVPIKRSSGGVRKDGTVPFHHYFVWLDQVIAANLHTLFPGMKVVEAHPFRVTRDADTTIQELEASDLLETIEESVRQRRFGSVVRMSINEAMPARIRDLLIENLEMDRNDVYSIDGQLGFSSLMTLYSIDRYDLKEVPFVPATPKVLDGRYDDGNIFAAIRREDILLHHPYDSFMPVVDFLKTAAHDPDVLAIKQTLYRVGRNAPVVEALLEASLNNKQVAVLVELKARFDEESNITWARALEAEGVHVVYGLLGLKTHSKIALVIRKEGDSIRRYIHVSTGNYNTQTAQTYTDIGMFTCDKEIGADATDLFNYLTGYSEKTNFRKLIVAPINMRARMEALIKREIEQQRKNKRGQLIFKINSLVDKGMIQLLYQASQAGVKIDLLVRGMCCLRPGVPGVSDNIKVTSIVGRFLEHSRIFYFRNGGEEEVYVGSADLMPRNIDRRVEILFPVQDARLIKHLRDEVLATYLADAAKARYLQPDGSYTRIKKSERESGLNSQARLLMHRPIEGKEKK